MVFAAFVSSVVQFSRSLYTGEGYLTFSLPVSTDQLLIGKMLAAIIAMFVGAAFWGLNPVCALFLCLVAVGFFLPLRAFGSAFHVAMNGASAGKKIISLLNTPDPVWGTQEVSGKRRSSLTALRSLTTARATFSKTFP